MKPLQIFYSFSFFIIFFLFLCEVGFSVTSSPTYSKKNSSADFLPGLSLTSPIELAIPDDFVMVSKKGTPDVEQGIFWGKKETLDRYFAGQLPLDSCIVAVKTSADVHQSGPKTFNTSGAAKKDWKLWGGSKLNIRKLNWGEYPILSAECASLQGVRYYLAWLGLNEEEGRTIMFAFLFPDEKNKPSDLELAIWYHFLQNSHVDFHEKNESNPKSYTQVSSKAGFGQHESSRD